jgi:hypothetical protein
VHKLVLLPDKRKCRFFCFEEYYFSEQDRLSKDCLENDFPSTGKNEYDVKSRVWTFVG